MIVVQTSVNESTKAQVFRGVILRRGCDAALRSLVSEQGGDRLLAHLNGMARRVEEQ